MPEKKQNKLTAEMAKKTLSDLFSALKYMETAAPDLTIEGFKALLIIALASWDKDALRLPNVTKISKMLDKSPSRASRIIATLSDPEGLALVDARSGLSGTRSESLILTETGKNLTSQFLELLTTKAVEQLPIQDFEGLQAAKARAQEFNRGEDLYLKQSEYDKDTLTLKIGPRSDVMSDEVQDWCRNNLSKLPTMTADADQVYVSFAKVSDAVYFKLRWCW